MLRSAHRPGASAEQCRYLVILVLALPPARFEAASIKPAAADNQMVGLLYKGGSTMQAGGTLRQLVAMSLQLSPNLANDNSCR